MRSKNQLRSVSLKAGPALCAALAAGLLSACDRSTTTEEAARSLGPYVLVDLSGGPEAKSYPVTFPGELPADFANENYKTTKLLLKWIEPGSFKMGAASLATPVHSVSLSSGYYLAVYEVTQAQWENVMGATEFQFAGNPTHPAESVSWEDIRGDTSSHDWPRVTDVSESSFMGRLTARTPDTIRFDLPTEAQWEFACRAGTEGDYSCEDDIDDHAWSIDNCDEESTQVVGTRKPNPWDLYDLHGNVAEWCRDRHGAYSPESQSDPVGPSRGWRRVWRGGAWDVGSYLAQSATRSGGRPTHRFPQVGFRPVGIPTH